MPAPDDHRRTRFVLGFAVVSWAVAIVALLAGMRARVKPLIIVGLVTGALALALTQFWLRRGRLPR